MFGTRLGKKFLGAVICVTGLLLISSPVLAVIHEDPDAVTQTFSGISLLNYYTESLDFVLQKDPAAVTARLEKVPFANVPQSLVEPAQSFATSGIRISYLVLDIDGNTGKLAVLRAQFRLQEATELAAQISGNISQAYLTLGNIEQAATITGTVLKVSAAPDGSALKTSYNELLIKIGEIRKMLDLYEELLKTTGLTPEELLKATGLTLEIQPSVAFVGDNISFTGVLTSGGAPLAGREVDILLNSSKYTSANTDDYGHYQGTLMVPYRYLPELDIQALYYPQGKDLGAYLASLSPIIKLQVLFYETNLKLTLEDKAYPGRDTTATGKFDYGDSPLPDERRVEIYLDDVYITEAMAKDTFAQKITIAPDIEPGKHVVTVSAAAIGRYSPAVATAVLNVTRATPILDISTPKVTLIPGSVNLNGRLYSEIGPLSKASVKIGMGKSQVEITTSEDGTFETTIKMGMGLGLIGSQDMVIQVIPREPWHAALTTTRPVLMVNMMNITGILVIVVILAIYLPARLKRRLGAIPGIPVKPAPRGLQPEQSPAYSGIENIPIATGDNVQESGTYRDKIFYWYRLAVKLLGKLSKALLGPQQTLREFARENSGRFGPFGKYFTELTNIVERLLYSPHAATEQDVENSKKIVQTIEDGVKG